MSYCSNISCPAQMFRWIGHFAGVMDIEGLGERWISILLDRGLIKDPADIYFLTKDQLVALERMGDVLADKILKNVEASKQRNLPRLLFALGIRHVGGEVAQLLAAHFHNLDALMEASAEDIRNVEGIGPKIADSIHAYFRDEQKRAIIEKLRKAGVNFEYKRPKRVEGPLIGPVVRLYRHARRRCRAARPNRSSPPSAPRREAASRARSHTSWPAPILAPSSRRRRTTASRSSTRMASCGCSASTAWMRP